MLTGFSDEVQQKLKYYVYVLVDPRSDEIFYVGQGCRNRVFEHESQAKLDTIIDLLDHNLKPKKYIVIADLTKEEALKVEAALINVYLHHSMPLENVQSGNTNEIAYQSVEHVENLFRKQSLSPADLDSYSGRKMLVKLPTQSIRLLSDEDEVRKMAKKEATLPIDIHLKPEIILATTERGVIIQVYRAIAWEIVEIDSVVSANKKYRYYRCSCLELDFEMTGKLKNRKVDLQHGGFCLQSGAKLYYTAKR